MKDGEDFFKPFKNVAIKTSSLSITHDWLTCLASYLFQQGLILAAAQKGIRLPATNETGRDRTQPAQQ